MTRLMPDVKNGDVVRRLEYGESWFEWMSREGMLARHTDNTWSSNVRVVISDL